MKLKPYHIQTIADGAVFAAPMPSADTLAQEIKDIRSHGIDKVLCLQETTESVTLGLVELEALCLANGIQFQRFEIPDYGVPEYQSLRSLISELQTDFSNGVQLLIHCRGGIGRTGLVCSCLAITTCLSADDAMALVTTKRGQTVPETEAQVDLIRRFEADFTS